VDHQGEQCSEAMIVRTASVQDVNSLHSGHMARKILVLNKLNRCAPEKVLVDKIRPQNQTMTPFCTKADALGCSVISQ
jgi:hypothetical protein